MPATVNSGWQRYGRGGQMYGHVARVGALSSDRDTRLRETAHARTLLTRADDATRFSRRPSPSSPSNYTLQRCMRDCNSLNANTIYDNC